ncbi:Hsp20/alpha crystallin family protein [Rhizobium mesosinicum]|uniref:Hsp20/alpha crystallin family protein n=1 Tax=Rhizobium mesosinicum TaxID=335017 RepID=UPI003083F28A
MPGLDEKNIEVTLSNSYLTIRGEKQDEKEDKQKECHVLERRYGSFQRTFQIPAGGAP